MVTLVGQVGKSSHLVPGCVGITHNKDLWKPLCAGDFSGESMSQSDSKGRLRMILILGGHAEPDEVGVLCHPLFTYIECICSRLFIRGYLYF
jgi:hypothetical protein